eukprot:TRINITY_DN5878_c0_g1_i1.p1 TRINITY_DN5878_c0_g1~~TRINITY_DN5878_c0_g1_i1.p1  ORF type:complete len:413 (-),score=103.07 TRINITY_DN5878_c0_g1_i1:455-1693(-)
MASSPSQKRRQRFQRSILSSAGKIAHGCSAPLLPSTTFSWNLQALEFVPGALPAGMGGFGQEPNYGLLLLGMQQQLNNISMMLQSWMDPTGQGMTYAVTAEGTDFELYDTQGNLAAVASDFELYNTQGDLVAAASDFELNGAEDYLTAAASDSELNKAEGNLAAAALTSGLGSTQGDLAAAVPDFELNSTEGNVAAVASGFELSNTQGHFAAAAPDFELNGAEGNTAAAASVFELNNTQGNLATAASDLELNNTKAPRTGAVVGRHLQNMSIKDFIATAAAVRERLPHLPCESHTHLTSDAAQYRAAATPMLCNAAWTDDMAVSATPTKLCTLCGCPWKRWQLISREGMPLCHSCDMHLYGAEDSDLSNTQGDLAAAVPDFELNNIEGYSAAAASGFELNNTQGHLAAAVSD